MSPIVKPKVGYYYYLYSILGRYKPNMERPLHFNIQSQIVLEGISQQTAHVLVGSIGWFKSEHEIYVLPVGKQI